MGMGWTTSLWVCCMVDESYGGRRPWGGRIRFAVVGWLIASEERRLRCKPRLSCGDTYNIRTETRLCVCCRYRCDSILFYYDFFFFC
jgi:hypothetical protein